MTGERHEVWLRARDVRVGDRLVVSSTEVVNVERRGSEVVRGCRLSVVHESALGGPEEGDAVKSALTKSALAS